MAATWFAIDTRTRRMEGDIADEVIPNSQMIQGSAMDFTLRVLLDSKREMDKATLLEYIEAIYLDYIIRHTDGGHRVYPKAGLEKTADVVDALYNYIHLYPPSTNPDKWPFQSVGGFSNCSFKYSTELKAIGPGRRDIVDVRWFEGTIDRVEITVTGVTTIDWKRGGASPYPGYEYLIYSMAVTNKIVAQTIMLAEDADIYNLKYTERTMGIEVGKPADAFYQIPLMKWKTYKRSRGSRQRGEFYGERFYAFDSEDEERIQSLRQGLFLIIRFMREGLIAKVEGIHCWQCQYRHLCYRRDGNMEIELAMEVLPEEMAGPAL